MKEHEGHSPFRTSVRGTAAGLTMAVFATVAVTARADPPGGPAEAPAPVSFAVASTLVRDMLRQQVVVSSDGRSEQKVVVPAPYCATLGAGASKTVNLPDIRWGLRTTTPVPITRRTRVVLHWPGQPPREEVLADGERSRVPVQQTVCVSDVFVLDPRIEIRVNVAGRQGQGDPDSRTSF